MRSTCGWLCGSAVLALFGSTAAWAESAPANLHLEPGAAFGLNVATRGTGSGISVKLDFPAVGLGPVSPQLHGFALGIPSSALPAAGNLYGAGLGLRLRLLDDHQGYWLHMGSEEGHQGNLFGNLWLDLGVDYGSAGLGLGVNAAAGAELSVLDGLQLGPFVKVARLGDFNFLLAGMSFTVGAPDKDQRHDPDPDKDGVLGAKDRCPEQPEDKDGFQDEDGCPDSDNDADGIADDKDKCPGQPEDKDGVDDADGCPEDDDQDGIADEKDQCRKEPEDKDGFQDEDGCPDLDDDADGIPDAKDACPREAEDKDGFQDEDGCPDADNDADGVADEKDKCPDQPETRNGVDDEDGCPEQEVKAFIEKQRIVITEKIFFDFNKATIQKKSHPLLKNVAELLQRFPELRRLSVEGHTDDVGTDEANQKLSERRAKAVQDFLVKAGVAADRLESKGFGKSRPLEPGTTEAARERNRRVEFVIVDPPEGLLPVRPPAPADGGQTP